MPLYEYECGACGHRFEVIQKFSDSPVEKCPLCAEPVHKLLSAPAIQFKGTGWYVTDYASKRNTDAAADKKASTPASSASSGSSASGGSDSAKPAAASDSGGSSSSSESGKSSSSSETSSSTKTDGKS